MLSSRIIVIDGMQEITTTFEMRDCYTLVIKKRMKRLVSKEIIIFLITWCYDFIFISLIVNMLMTNFLINVWNVYRFFDEISKKGSNTK